ncbi:MULTISPECIES: phage major capsid protein [unclassified Sedimentibacter]|uniref:phage major capsid protein n=1 Tax=unclassified Sedimentibacter TaxID=2649220 RepID=UPI0027E0F08D|nr:phage major capsid protein [Sedimentibacter sp. MB35-C1]WMJ78476.1 phage major capsid protein [Sedimentibacter sp. MB35-C1]
MALKQLMIAKKIEQRNASLAELSTQEEGLKTREAELEVALEEAQTDEEIALVEENTDKLETEKEELEEKKSKLEGEIAELEGELEKLNSKEPKSDSKEPEQIKSNPKGEGIMKRYKFFSGMTREAVDALLVRNEVQEFLTRTRELIGQKRAVTGGELNIPDVMLELLRDNLHKYSKLISRVNLKPVNGKARQNIAGTVPEGIWTEMVAKLNELSIVFNQFEVDGYKVGGFIPVANSLLEDSDINLANEILVTLGQAIGLAVDKAILYGKGVKMPVGIVTRLAETAQPAYWGTKEKDWTDLHTTNLLLIDAAANTDVLFYKDLILKLGKVKANYATGGKTWCMNENTFATLQAKALSINASGAIVSGQTKTMPVVSGEIEFLEFIPDNVIIGGYMSLYLLAERKGATLAQSEHAQFIEDNTIFKGTARYDGRPVIGEAFVAINISQEDLETPPTATAVTFAADTAN